MAAQAVDFTVSGHINRALFITDSDASTSSSVKDNASSGTRVRFTGSSEMEMGGSAGVNLEYGAGSTLGLRYGEVWFSGGYGKVEIGHGDHGGEGSVYNDKSGVFGIGHGQDNAGVTKVVDPHAMATGATVHSDADVHHVADRKALNYYGSLDGGGARGERIRYSTPSVGPISAKFSVGNGDKFSAGLKLSQDFNGNEFSASLGTVQLPGSTSTISGSAGVKLASGLTISGAWGKGKDHAGLTTPPVAGMDAVPAMYKDVWAGGVAVDDTTGALSPDANNEVYRVALTKGTETRYILVSAADTPTATTLNTTGLDNTWDLSTGKKLGTGHGYTFKAGQTVTTFDGLQTAYETAVTNHKTTPTLATKAALDKAQKALNQAFKDFGCDPASGKQLGDDKGRAGCTSQFYSAAKAAVAGTAAMATTVDPSFFQGTIGYVFGNTSVGVSWYQSNDFVREGSKLVAIGFGANHNLPKVGAQVYAAVQNYDVTEMKGGPSKDTTVAMIGTRIKF